MIKVLVTSVGSLVGKNILDTLELPPKTRRSGLRVIGTNSDPGSPNNFRCDECYLVPPTASSAYRARMTEILRTVQPDLVLYGRDQDTYAVGTMFEWEPDLAVTAPQGTASAMLLALEKHESWRFARRHSLPFADTMLVDESLTDSEMRLFSDRHGFPLIAKPNRGFASKGVYFVRDWAELISVRELEGYVLQEYLGATDANDDYFREIDGLTPLFAHAPNIYHHSSHLYISKSGTISEPFISENRHNAGATVGFRRVWNDEVASLTHNFANALLADGASGPVTVQFRRDRHGGWKAQEMNLRTNGNTYPRALLGQDDLKLIIDDHFPLHGFDAARITLQSDSTSFVKQLMPEIVDDGDSSTLAADHHWIAE